MPVGELKERMIFQIMVTDYFTANQAKKKITCNSQENKHNMNDLKQ